MTEYQIKKLKEVQEKVTLAETILMYTKAPEQDRIAESMAVLSTINPMIESVK